MALVIALAAGVAFHAPLYHAPRGSATAPARTTGLVAPIAHLRLEDLRTTAEVLKANAQDGPDRVRVVDQFVRASVYACRITLGAGVATTAAAGAMTVLYSARTVLTMGPGGTARAVNGLMKAQSTTTWLQHGSALLYYPLELWRWWSALLPSFAGLLHLPVAPVTATRQALSILWLVEIGSSAADLVRQDRASFNVLEKQQLRRRLRKLALDAPLAVNLALPQAPLPLLVVGLLGSLTSSMQVHNLLADARCPHVIRDSTDRRVWFKSPALRLPTLQPLRTVVSSSTLCRRGAMAAPTTAPALILA